MRSGSELALLLALLFPLIVSGGQVPPGFTDTQVTGGLSQPTACEFAPDGRLFILLKQGAVRIYKNGNLVPGNALVLAVNSQSERGLLGIAFDPDFLQNHFLYLYYTTPGSNPKNRVSRFTIQGDTIDPASEAVLVDGIRSDAGNHNAGWIQFGSDGFLYIATGDGGADPQQAQNLNGINGKILRVDRNGAAPPDNPFVGQAGRRSEIWCFGLRNPWRFTFDPDTGTMLIGDVGQDSFEEVNIGTRGANYGWPNVEGPSSNTNFASPIYSYSHNNNSASVTGGVVYRGSTFPQEYRGAYFFADYVLGFIRYLKLSATNTVLSVHDFSPDAGSVVHITQGPDDALYYALVDSGQIRRIRFGSGTNREPVVQLQTSRRSGPLPLSIRFSAEDSFDPDGGQLQFSWTFGDGGTANTSIAQHTFDEPQNRVVRLTVTDSQGASKSTTVRVFPGDRAPAPLITEPAAGSPVRPGQTVRFRGRASDPEDGPLNATQLTWTVVLHHNNHTHPFLGPLTGVTAGSFTIPRNDHTDGTVFYRIRLKATDSRGLSVFRSVDLPRQ